MRRPGFRARVELAVLRNRAKIKYLFGWPAPIAITLGFGGGLPYLLSVGLVLGGLLALATALYAAIAPDAGRRAVADDLLKAGADDRALHRLLRSGSVADLERYFSSRKTYEAWDFDGLPAAVHERGLKISTERPES